MMGYYESMRVSRALRREHGAIHLLNPDNAFTTLCGRPAAETRDCEPLREGVTSYTYAAGFCQACAKRARDIGRAV